MHLSKANLAAIKPKQGLEIPATTLFDLPEKILQFGTGVLLRALPDYFVDKANKKGIFNGRIVVIKSTDGDSKAFDDQDGLYTICVRGIEDGATIQKDIINASISRVINANTQWQEVLRCATNPEIKIVFSNTTEVGIQMSDDILGEEMPASFPGKLLAILLKRFQTFNGSEESGMVIVPTELITDNGDSLKKIIFELAALNDLDAKFVEWLSKHNRFCNSLVDRIVPGKPKQEQLEKTFEELGYKDELLTNSEVFKLWAIEGDEKVKSILSFCEIDDAVVITPDISLFKELKLRLLNGTHTFTCALAFLAGFEITRNAVNDVVFSSFVKELMNEEIAPAIPYDIEEKLKITFSKNVLDRFANPFIDHYLISITVQYTSKMRMRNIPLIMQHYSTSSEAPKYMASGFAGYLLFMKATKEESGKYFGDANGQLYEIKDESADYFYNQWKNNNSKEVVTQVLQNEELWGADLSILPGWLDAVQQQLESIMANGVLKTISALQTEKMAIENEA